MLSDYLETFLQIILPKYALTRFAGLLANVQSPNIKNVLIRSFIKKYGVNMSEAREEVPESYASFNEFFVRQLKPECRPLEPADIVSPVDGSISALGRIENGQIFQAKGRDYSVAELLACDATLSRQFTNGYFATLYLAPKDYHRIHMPIDAKLKEIIYVPGKLFSVQPTTVRLLPHLFARNERLIIFFDTAAGLMAMVLIGAIIVGAIGTRWQGVIKRSPQQRYLDLATLSQSETLVMQGEEMGYFKLGSTVVLLFANGKEIHWDNGLRAGSAIRYNQAFASVK
jgi:phosphatidylserine decarboxylase